MNGRINTKLNRERVKRARRRALAGGQRRYEEALS
jgi:hypothetical protein